MLTEQELKAIEKEAEVHSGQDCFRNLGYTSSPVIYVKCGYIKGATQERIKAKALIEALEKINELPQTIGHAYQMQDISKAALNSYNTKQIEP